MKHEWPTVEAASDEVADALSNLFIAANTFEREIRSGRITALDAAMFGRENIISAQDVADCFRALADALEMIDEQDMDELIARELAQIAEEQHG